MNPLPRPAHIKHYPSSLEIMRFKLVCFVIFLSEVEWNRNSKFCEIEILRHLEVQKLPQLSWFWSYRIDLLNVRPILLEEKVEGRVRKTSGTRFLRKVLKVRKVKPNNQVFHSKSYSSNYVIMLFDASLN